MPGRRCSSRNQGLPSNLRTTDERSKGHSRPKYSPIKSSQVGLIEKFSRVFGSAAGNVSKKADSSYSNRQKKEPSRSEHSQTKPTVDKNLKTPAYDPNEPFAAPPTVSCSPPANTATAKKPSQRDSKLVPSNPREGDSTSQRENDSNKPSEV
jgi:hypothetical protein